VTRLAVGAIATTDNRVAQKINGKRMKTGSTLTRTPLPYVLRTLYEAQVVEALFQLGLMNRKPSKPSEIF